jgi:glycosyltransferase involved in cell wall biosynthesis
MNIAYVTDFDVLNILEKTNWTKRAGHWAKCYYLAKSLADSSITIQYLGPLNKKNALLPKLKWRFYKYLTSKTYHAWAEPIFNQGYAAQITTKLTKLNSDIVLSPDINLIAYLNCDQPVIIWVDSTFAGFIDFYADYNNLCKESIQHLKALDQLALDRCKLAIFSSDWAAQKAIVTYQVDPIKVKVVPYGANFDCDRTQDDIKNIIESRSRDVCKLLFLGVDWIRKGGNIALEVAKALNTSGIKTELTLVGCNPATDDQALPNFVRSLGFINRSTHEGQQLVDQLLAESHFLILPSQADCTPHVLVEANAFGVPCITTKVGGIPTTIHDDLNGKTFSLDADIADYCAYIARLMQHYNEYKILALSSFNEYETRLNWSVAGQTVRRLLLELLTD